MFSESYIKKEQMAGAKNDQATRKSPEHITWVKALGLIMLKKYPPKLYKIEFATVLVKCFLTFDTRIGCAFYEIS
jgi:hypothetical protein